MQYLKQKDKKLGAVIDRIGHINRQVHSDLFSALVNCIVGQQISTKAQQTIWNRLLSGLKEITPETIANCTEEELKSYGISYRKAGYIKSSAEKILTKELDIEALREQSDEQICKSLVSLKGVGVWTAEMLMIFSLQRPDVLSYGDLAIIRGMRMLYHHKEITPELFQKYKKRYSPYATTASLYLWAIAGGE